MKGSLLLVSAWADAKLRADVAAGMRPRLEFLELEQRHGMEVLDWSRLGAGSGRSRALAVRHAAAGLRRVRDYDVVFSDGEHVGIPLALAMSLLRRRPHVVIGHHLTAAKKRAFFTLLKAHRGMTRIIVHSRMQMESANVHLGIPRDRLDFIPYSADTLFWRPLDVPEERVIVAAGREHRDYALLAGACEGLGHQVLIAAGSTHSPNAVCTMPPAASSALIRTVNHAGLRDWYARAAVVVVPLIPNDFQAGVTTILEAMAMGKAVVVTATAGQRDIVVDGETGILVQPGDEAAMRKALERLLDDPAERARLGLNARFAVEKQFSLDRYVEALAASLRAAAA